MTFAIMILMPVVQLVLFGYAINTDPRHMAAVVEMREDGPFDTRFLAGLAQSIIFRHRRDRRIAMTEAEQMMRSGKRDVPDLDP